MNLSGENLHGLEANEGYKLLDFDVDFGLEFGFEFDCKIGSPENLN